MTGRNPVHGRVAWHAGSAFALLGAALWVASLWLPAIGVRGGPTLTGLDVLQQGWSAWRYGVLAWFANPALLAALVSLLLHARRAAVLFACAGLALGLSSIWAGDLARLGGRSVPELSFGAGFYLWMAAHSAAVIGGIVTWTRSPDRQPVRRIRKPRH